MIIIKIEDQSKQMFAILCQVFDFFNDKKKPLKSRKNPVNSGKKWQRKVRKKLC